MTSTNSTSVENNQEKKKKATVVSRGWMVTINNPKIPGDAYLNQWLADGLIVFGCGQLEKAPETGTPHHQMYVVTKVNPSNKNGFTTKWMKENIHSTAHFDKRMGTHEEAKDYCTLPEYKGKKKIVIGGPWVVGQWDAHHELTVQEKKKGGEKNATKIEQVKNMIDQGARDEELYQKHFGEMLRYSKGFERYRVAKKDTSRNWQTKAICLYGPPGTGKSKTAYDLARSKYDEDFYPLSLEGDKVWWDGYSGQKCVIIEEFFGQMKISYLLKLLDRYPMLVQTKGGMTPLLAETIIFTSNVHPDDWYGKGPIDDMDPNHRSKIPQNVLDALKRRFTGKCGTIEELKEQLVLPNDDPDMAEVLKEWKKQAAQPKKVVPPTPAPTPAPIDIRAAQQMPIDITNDDDDEDFTDSGYIYTSKKNKGVMGAADKALPDGDEVAIIASQPEYEEPSGSDSIEGDGYIEYDTDPTTYNSDEATAARIAAFSAGVTKNLLERRNAMTSETTNEYWLALMDRQKKEAEDAAYWAEHAQRQKDAEKARPPKPADPPTPRPGTPLPETAPTQPPPPTRKRALGLLPPPKAPPSEFKKYKQIPGQAKIVMVTNDHDDDIDDK